MALYKEVLTQWREEISPRLSSPLLWAEFSKLDPTHPILTYEEYQVTVVPKVWPFGDRNMNLILVLSPQDVFSLGLCMTEFLPDQAQEVTESILLKAGPSLPQTHLSDLLLCTSSNAECFNILHQHATILTFYLFPYMSQLYFLHLSLTT